MPAPGDRRHRAIVVGYGPVGRSVVRLLQENGIEPTVVELNYETVRAVRESGVAAVHGDANHPDTLLSAGVETTGSLVLSASATPAVENTIRIARELNPELRILARSDYLNEVPLLLRAGAEKVVSGEVEVALALTVAILDDLGATPEQIDRERARVHADLLAPAPVNSPVSE